MNYFTKAKPYNSLNEYYKTRYGKKVTKIALNASFTCPNRDGKKGYGGCTFCCGGSGEYENISIKDQFEMVKNTISNKWPDTLYIPYFQAYSNTYKPVNELKVIYEEAISLAKDKIAGIAIATRADCIDEEISDYLGELNKKVPVSIELGVQTSNEKTSIRINRCMNNDEIIKAVNLLRHQNIEVILHIINGLPDETIEDNLKTIEFVNSLDIQGIKIHSLLLLNNTKLYEEYKKEPFHILSMDEYVEIVCMEIAHLRDDIIIHRLQADAKEDELIEPMWTRKKFIVMNNIDKYMRNNNLYQGKFYINKGNPH